MPGRKKPMNEVGDVIRGIDGDYMIRPPEASANGHRIADRCIAAAQPCSCSDRHISWYCEQCEHVTYGPSLGVNCEVLHRPTLVW
jgi:hypothetical protein